MAPAGTSTTNMLRQTVYYHLDNFSLDNALFFAERLYAHEKNSSESAFLLALCHFRLGDSRSAYEISKTAGQRGIHMGCAYVFAQSCLALGRFRDGITALEKSRSLWAHKSNLGKHTAYSRMPYPDSSAVNCLLGKLYRGHEDKKRAMQCFEDALKVNPFMWDAFTSLCDMRPKNAISVPNIFKVTEPLARAFDQEPSSAVAEQRAAAGSSSILDVLSKKSAARSAAHSPGIDPFEFQQQQQQRSTTAFQDLPSSANLLSLDTEENDFMSKIAAFRARNAAASAPVLGSDGMETPTGPTAVADTNAWRGTSNNPEPPQAPSRKTRTIQPLDPAAEAPRRMGYRLGSRKRDKPLDASSDNAAAETATTLMRSSTMSSIAAERKRTASGHPVHARQAQAEEPGAPQRRSARLNMFKPSVAKANSGANTIGSAATRELRKARPPISRIMRPGSSGSTVGRVVSGNRKPLEENSMDIDHAEIPRAREQPPPPPPPAATRPTEPEPPRIEEVLKAVLDLLRKFGTGYYSLSQFRCQDAVAVFGSLPRAHQDTPWVLAHVARAHYEQTNYAEAEKFFRRVRILAPTRLEDMEVYSTILWHLKRETDLSFLAHELVDSAWHSPQAWCALGNAWSLAADHEQALRCFKRATQLDPAFAYAYTLQGHEHVQNEEYDKALTAYRGAIAADRSHYNAFYGIGRVYEKLGNYDKAYVHYESASRIHPTNAVLICCLGTVLEKQKQIRAALHKFREATELAPRAAQTRFKKARALLALGELKEAQQELMVLKDLAPDEARVHFLLGKLYKTVGDKNSAVRHFTVALSLDPKASQQIKEAIESLEDDDGFDDSMMG